MYYILQTGAQECFVLAALYGYFSIVLVFGLSWVASIPYTAVRLFISSPQPLFNYGTTRDAMNGVNPSREYYTSHTPSPAVWHLASMATNVWT